MFYLTGDSTMIRSVEDTARVKEETRRDVGLWVNDEARKAALNYIVARMCGKSRETRRYYLAQLAGFVEIVNMIAEQSRWKNIVKRRTVRAYIRVVSKGE